MFLCGVWLRPNQGTMDRIRAAFAALKTQYFCTTAILPRGSKSGHNPWQTDHAKAMDARRGATKQRCRTTKYTELRNWRTVGLRRWSSTSTTSPRLTSVMMHLCRPRLRYESTLYIRGVDSNTQAGPLCQRPVYKSSADALVRLQRAQGKGVPHISIHLRTRQRDALHPAVQQHLEWLSFNWKTCFSSSSSSTWTESPT